MVAANGRDFGTAVSSSAQQKGQPWQGQHPTINLGTHCLCPTFELWIRATRLMPMAHARRLLGDDELRLLREELQRRPRWP